MRYYIGIRKVLLYSQSLTIQFRLRHHLLALEEESQSILVSVPQRHLFYFFGLLPRPKGHRRESQKKTARYDDDKKNIKGLTRAGRNFIEQFLCSIAAIATLSGHAWWTVCSMTSSSKTMPTMLMTNEGMRTKSTMSMNP